MEIDIEKIENYLDGKLSPEEKIIFEKDIESKSELKSALDEYKKLIRAIGIYSDRKKIVEIVEKTHGNLISQMEIVTAAASKNKRFVIGKRELGIAASMTLIISIGTYLIMNFVSAFGGNEKAHYKQLSKDIEKVKSSQDKIIRELKAEKSGNQSNIRQASFGGTAIAISENGFILTSYHVVKDVDSVYIENVKYNRLKLKKVFTEPTLDLVIMKVDDPNFKSFDKLPFTFRKSEMDLGEIVYTLGFPKKDIVFGEGYISSLNGYEGDTSAYQISVPVNPGQSGGPLFDNFGNLVGIVSGKHSENESSAFAVKANYLKNTIMVNDSLSQAIQLPKTNSLKGNSKLQMIKKVQDFVFEVKAYN